MAQCVDRTDQTTQNSLALPPAPYTNQRGEYTLQQIDKFADDLAKSILNDAEKNPIAIAVNQYGDDFYRASNYLNGSFRNRQTTQDNLSNYPDLQNRWNKGNITNLELADFIKIYNYTPAAVISDGDEDYLKLLSQLDSYYKTSFTSSILGGFCALMPQVFAAIDAFFDLVDQVDAIIQDAIKFLNKIRTFEGISSIVNKAAVEKLINEIKQKIVDAIEKVFDDVMNSIDNFDIEQIIGEVETFVVNGAIKQILTFKEQLCNFFTPENKKRITDKIKALIDYAVSLFENPNLEEIQFMVMRFCAFASNIEALIKDIKSPLNNYGFKYRRIHQRLKNISNLRTSGAISSGATRYSDEVKKETINSQQQEWNNEQEEGVEEITVTGEQFVNPPLPSLSEYTNLPKCGNVLKGTDPRVKISGDWVEDLGLQGYTRIDLDVKVYLMRMHEKLGVQFNIVNGWRSQQYNKKIEGSPESPYLTGLAIDIEKVDGVSDFDVEDAAIRSGFKTVDIYDDRIYLDIRDLPR
jgi:hypothetical protein